MFAAAPASGRLMGDQKLVVRGQRGMPKIGTEYGHRRCRSSD
jgi:hypothetical protein